MYVRIWISPQAISTLQDEARAAYRAPKQHLEWLIEQTLGVGPSEPVRARFERLEQQVGLAHASAGVGSRE